MKKKFNRFLTALTTVTMLFSSYGPQFSFAADKEDTVQPDSGIVEELPEYDEEPVADNGYEEEEYASEDEAIDRSGTETDENGVEWQIPAADWYTDYNYTLDEDNKIIYLTSANSDLAGNIIVPGKATIDSTEYSVVVGYPNQKKQSVWKECSKNITGIRFESGVKAREDSIFLFADLGMLENLDISGLDTSDVVSFYGYFYNCMNLKKLDASYLNTSNATQMMSMFAYCDNLDSLDISGFDTSNVNNMSEMFCKCRGLQKLVLGDPDTSNVNNMQNMFAGCSGLTKLDVGGLETDNVVTMASMFYDCYNLTDIDVSGFNIQNVTDMTYMFDGCKGLNNLDLRNLAFRNDCVLPDMLRNSARRIYLPDSWVSGYDFSNNKRLTKIYYAGSKDKWESLSCNVPGSVTVVFDYTGEIEAQPVDPSEDSWCSDYEFYIENDEIHLTAAKDTLSGDIVIPAKAVAADNSTEYKVVLGPRTNNLVSLWDKSKESITGITVEKGVKADADCSSMFRGLSAMSSGDLKGLDTSDVVYMNQMFTDCNSLNSLDVSGWNTKNVVSMSGMFNVCTSLTALDLSSFDTSKVTDMSVMFAICNCLADLKVSSFDTSNVTDMSYMFSSCNALKELDLKGFDTTNVVKMTGMFFYCSSLKELDVSGFDTSKVTDMMDMFHGCWRLKKLDISNFVIGKDCNTGAMTLNSSADRYLPSGWVSSYDFSRYIYIRNVMGSDGVIRPEEEEEKEKNLSRIYYPGTRSQWKELANTVPEGVRVICTDDNYAEPVDEWCKDYEYYIDEGELHLTAAKETVSGDIVVKSTVTASDNSVYKVVLGPRTDNTKSLWYAAAENITGITIEKGVIADKNSRNLFFDLVNLTKLDISGLVTSEVTDMSYMFYNCTGLKSLDLSTFDTSAVTNMSGMFRECYSLQDLNIKGFDTSDVVYMQQMFYGCRDLKDLDVGIFDTNNVTDMNYMFAGCSSLTALNVSGFKTSNVTNMSNMFCGCSYIKYLDLSGFDTAKVIDMSGMFDSSGLTHIDLSKFDTSNVTNMSYMFDYCIELQSIDLSMFNTAQVIDMTKMFCGCSKLTDINISNFDTSAVLFMMAMFRNCSNLYNLDIRSFTIRDDCKYEEMLNGSARNILLPVACVGSYTFDSERLRHIYYAGSEAQWIKLNNTVPDGVKVVFDYTGNTPIPPAEPVAEWLDDYEYCYDDEYVYLEEAKDTLSGNIIIPATVTASDNSIYIVVLSQKTNSKKSLWDKSKDSITGIVIEDGVVADDYCGYLFYDLNSLTQLDVRGLDTSRVTNMEAMFYNCSRLNNLDVSLFKTSKVTNMSLMFQGCVHLQSIDVSGFDTSSVENMFGMFMNCNMLKDLDVSGFNTSKTTSMGPMFASCVSLRSIDVSKFDTSKVINMNSMFAGCVELADLDVSNFVTSNVYNFASMFYRCNNLWNLDIRNFSFDAANDIQNMLSCDIKRVYLPVRWVTNYDFTSSIMENPKAIYYAGTKNDWDGLNNIVPESVDVYCDYSGNVIPRPVEPEAEWLNDYEYDFDEEYVYLKEAKDTLSGNIIVPATVTASDNTVYKVVLGPKRSTASSLWRNSKDNITGITIEDGVIADKDVCQFLFYNCNNIKRIDLSGLDTSNVTNMNFMFHSCSSLEFLDVSNCNTSNVMNMSYMFYGCYNLYNIDIRGFVINENCNIDSIFCDTSVRIYLPVKGIRSMHFTMPGNERYIYYAGTEEEWKELGNTISYGITIIYNYNGDVIPKPAPPIDEWCKDYNYILEDGKLVIFSAKNTLSGNIVLPAKAKAADNSEYSVVLRDKNGWGTSIWRNSSKNITGITIEDGVVAESCDSLFSDMENLKTLDISGLDTSGVTSMLFMFYECCQLESLDLTGLDTSNVTNMSAMCSGCTSLKSISINSIDTSKVTDMCEMFCQCESIKSIDLSGLDTSAVTDMYGLFMYCKSLESVNLNNIDTSKVTDIGCMFRSCLSLKHIDLSIFNTENVENMAFMFYNCSGLTDIDIRSFIIGKECSTGVMFLNSAKDIYLPENWIEAYDFSKFAYIDEETEEEVVINETHLQKIYYAGTPGQWAALNSIVPDGVEVICLKEDPVPVAGVTISPDCVELPVGDTQTLITTISPANATDKSVSWNSTAPEIAEVDQNGKITAVAPGEATITVTTLDGGFTASCKVTVKEPTVSVNGVSLSVNSIVLTEGESKTLIATVSPANATDKSVIWNSTAPEIAEVDQSGKITAVAAGEATVTVTTLDGGFTASCKVTVKEPTVSVNGVSLSVNSIELTEGESKTLIAAVSPANATDKSVSWNSSAPEIAKVDQNGKITALAAGEATVTVTTLDGGFTASCKVTVKAATVSVNGVKLSADKLELTEGESKTLTATVSPANATNKNVTYSSSKTSVATVDANGTVTAVAAGEALITVRTEDGGYTAECSVTVKALPQIIHVSGVKVLPASAVMNIDDTKSLSAVVSPADATDKSVSWSSSVPSVATVDANGTVTAVAAGETLITAKTTDGGYTASCKITVSERPVKIVNVNAISISPASLELTIGDTRSLTAAVSPADATDKSVAWSSSDASVVNVNDNGFITALAEGEAVIRVTATDGGFTAECSVKVNPIIEDVEPEFFFTETKTSTYSTVYTGSAITPDVSGIAGEKELVYGTDYTVKYSKNTDAGTGRVTVTGRGSFQGTYTLDFTIGTKAIDDGKGGVADGIVVGGLTVKGNDTVKPVISYMGKEVNTKCTPGTAADGTEIVSITANGSNFTGTIKDLPVNRIADKKEFAKTKIKVSIPSGCSYYYDGTEKLLGSDLTVTDQEGRPLTEGTDYEVSYPADTVNAGTVKVNVTAINGYSGSVSKSYKIKAAKDAVIKAELVPENTDGSYTYVKSGVTPAVNVKATINGNTYDLTEGVDYTVKYSNNKKAGAVGKCTLTMKGNYSGSKVSALSYNIDKASLADALLFVGDMKYSKPASSSKFRSKPVVTLDGELVATGEYTVNYTLENGEALPKKIKLTDDDPEMTVVVTVTAKTGKSSNFKDGDNSVLTATYRIYKDETDAEKTDISKAKISLVEVGGTKGKTKVSYTGNPITFEPGKSTRQADICIKIGKEVLRGADVYKYFEVSYANNTEKGKATIILTAKEELEDESDNPYSGMKTGTFTITKKKLK